MMWQHRRRQRRGEARRRPAVSQICRRRRSGEARQRLWCTEAASKSRSSRKARRRQAVSYNPADGVEAVEREAGVDEGEAVFLDSSNSQFSSVDDSNSEQDRPTMGGCSDGLVRLMTVA